MALIHETSVTLSTTMACDPITSAFISETGRINASEIFRRNVRTNPIVDLTMEHRGAWMDGMGVVVHNLTTTRNFPLSPAASRTNVSASDGASVDACLPPVITLKDGQITQPYQLRHLALNTLDYCFEDIRSNTAFVKVMAQKRTQLAEISRWVWEDWFTKDYYEISGHNVTQQVGGAWDNNTNGYSVANPPTAGLSSGYLEDIAVQINGEGVLPVANDMDTGEAVNMLLIGAAASKNLIRSLATLRDDVRYAWMGAQGDSPLLPGGMPRKARQFGGYIHRVIQNPRRFNIVGGAYVQIQPLVESGATKGTQQNANPAYRYATYEEVIVWNPNVYRSLAPNTMPATADWNFKPQNYMGHFEAKNIPNKECNPDGNKIFFRAKFMDAAEPLQPSVGYTILVLNCGFDLTGPACTPAVSSSSA